MPKLDSISNPGEQWTPLVGWPNYLISDQGRVFSLKRKRLKLLQTTKRGYHNVCLRKIGRKTYTGISRLMLLSFKGDENPAGALQAAHNDGIPGNNLLTNLRWATAQENSDDKYRHGTMMAGESHYAAKLTDLKVRIIRRLTGSAALTQKRIGEIFGISKGHVNRIARRTRWKSVLGENYG